MNLTVSPLSRINIRLLAKRIHQIVGDNPMFDIVGFIELVLPQIDPAFDCLEIAEDYELPDCYARAFPDQHKIVVRNSVYVGAVAGRGRDRFTLCHELGHYILHCSEKISYARNNKKNIPKYLDPEWQANTFAGELLIPIDVARTRTIEEIVNMCGVSYMAAEVQKSKASMKKNKPTSGFKAC